MKKFAIFNFFLVCALFAAGVQCSVAHAEIYTISVSDGASGTTVAEGTTSQVVTVTISPAVIAGDEVQISYKTIDSTARAANGDYTEITNGSLTFSSAHASAQEIDLTTHADGLVENDEKLTISVFNPVITSGTSTVSLGTGGETDITVTSNDTAEVTLNGVTTSGNEGATLSYEVTLSSPVDSDVTVNYSFAGSGTESAEVADLPSGGSVIIPAHMTSYQIPVVLPDDAIVEASEEFTMQLDSVNSTTSGVSLGSPLSATGTIQDNDTAVLSVGDESVAEDGTKLVFSVTSTLPVESPASVSFTYATMNGTAVSGDDYTGIGGTGIISGGMVCLLEVPITDDNIVEREETLSLQLSSPSSNATFSNNVAVGSITDNDSAVVDLVGVTTSAVEGSNLEYRVDLDHEASEDVTVTYTIAGSGSDVAEPSDYSSSGSVLISAGTQSGTLLIGVVDDAIVENSEELTVTLNGVSSGVSAVSLGTALSATGTLVDNDAAAVDLVGVTTSAVEGASLEYRVDLDHETSEDVTVTYTIAGSGSDVAEPSDYSSSGSVTISAGTQSGALLIDVVDDAIVENSEELTVTLNGVSSGVSAVSLGTGISAAGTLVDNDAAVVDLVGVTTSAVEGSNLEYRVDLDHEAPEDVIVTYTIAGSGSDVAEPSDYSSSGSVTISAGTQSGALLIDVVDDAIVENSEELTVTLSGVSSGVSAVSLGTALSAAGTLADNDAAAVDLVGVTTSAVEGASLEYRVDLDHETSEDVTVTYTIAGSGSDVAEPSDYSSSGSVTISAGTQSGTLLIGVVDDAIVENSEELTVTLNGVSSGVSAVSLGSALSATGTLADNDAAVVDLVGVTTSAVEGANLEYRVDLDHEASEDVTVTYTIAGSGSDVAEPSDYSSSGSVTISAGTQSGALLIDVVDDAIVENSEELTVTLNGVSSGVSAVSLGTALSATGTLIDNDAAVVDLVGVTTSAVEGTNLEYRIDLDHETSEDVTVTYTISGSGSDGAEPSDYSSSGSVTISAGTQSGALLIDVVDDAIVENSEELTVTLNGVSSGVSAVSLGTGISATGMLMDNDSAEVALFLVHGSEVEGSGADLEYRIDLSHEVSEDVIVTYTIAGYGADGAEPADYISNGSVTISAGDLSAPLVVAVVDDLIAENTEGLVVKLSGVVSGLPVNLGTSIGAYGSIGDNDSSEVSLTGVSTSDVEGALLQYQVVLTNEVSEDVVLNFTLDGSGADEAEASDYIGIASVTISAGSMGKSFPVSLVPDAIVENTEEFTVTLSSMNPVGPAVSIGAADSAVGTILDDDIAELSINDVIVYEADGTAVFTVSSAKVVSPTATVTFDYQTSDGTATAGTDYTAITGTTVIHDGSSITITVPILADNDTVEADETYNLELLNLSGVHASFVKDIGVGTILNDDFLITFTEVSPFGTLVETTSLGVIPSSGDTNAFVYPLNSSPEFLVTSANPCPNGLPHNGKVHRISDVLIDGVTEAGAPLQTTYPFTIANIAADHTIEALFTSLVDFTVNPNGHVETASGNVLAGTPDSIAIKSGGSLEVKAVPDTGFHISQVLVDGVNVGTPETYLFENWVDADATYEVSFALNSFVLKPVSTYETIFNDAAESIVATEKTVGHGQNGSFYVNLNDSSYAIHGVLVDNISYPVPASGVTVNYTGFSFINVGDDYLEVRFVSVNANHRLEVQDYDTSPISNTPLDAKLRPKPASLMFILDDSGSMDWEVITAGSNGLFNGDYYVYSYPSTDRARVYSNNSLEYHNDHDEWRSQFFGVNKMFYNPTVNYVPWPTFTGSPTSQLPAVASDGLAHANIYRPRLHPWHSQDCTDAINLANGVASANLNNCDNSTQDTHTFPMDDVFLEYEDNSNAIIVDNTDSGFSENGDWGSATNGDMYGSNYYYTENDGQPHSASWTFTPTLTQTYEVFVRWVDTDDREHIPYYIHSTNFTGLADTLNQKYSGGQWNSLGDFDFIAGESVVVELVDNYIHRSSSCADAVKIVPEGDGIRIINAHYFTWDDADNDGEVSYTDSDSDNQLDQSETISEDIYLVNLTNPIEYYKVLNNAQPVSSSNLQMVPAASLPATVQTYASPTAADAWELERQNWADWFSYYRKRTLAATGAVAHVIDQMEDVEVGIRTINYSSSYGISQSVLPVNVAGEVDQTNVLLEKLYSFQVDSYGTPLRRGLESVGKYYDDTDSDNGGIGTSPFHAQEDGDECKQVFAVLMTDGYWNGSSPSVGNADGDNGIPYADSYYPTLADVAMYYFEKDLSSMDDLVPDGIFNHQHMITYTVSFGVYGTLNPADFNLLKGPYPTWPNPGWGDRQKIDDMWHAAVNGRGQYMSASRPDELVDSLLEIMNDIGSRVGSGASVSVNGDEMSESISGQTRMFQTSYSSGGWYGDVKSYKVDTTTGEVVTSSPVWSAEDQLATKLTTTGAGHVNRVIATYSGATGTPFRWGNLTTLQQNQLFPYFIASASTSLTGENVVDYLRGDKTYETTSVNGEFRARDAGHPIGDVVNSLARFEDDVLYVGANDGMLHAFLATDAGLGEEIFAYVPNLVFAGLRELADPAYAHFFYVDSTPDTQKMGNKTYLVAGLGKGGKGYYCLDITGVLTTGTTRTSTVTTETDLASRVKWEYPAVPATLLSGTTFTFSNGTGSGGNDVIADSASGFSSTLFSVGQTIAIVGANYADGLNSGTNDGEYIIKYVDPAGGYIEIEADSLITGYGNGKAVTITQAMRDPHLGYSFSRAYFVRTNDTTIGSGDLRGWAIIFGNGYGSEKGTASLYIANPETGAIIKRIETGVGPFNGLSTPNATDVNNDLTADYVYAGDLLGNMWKFDLTSPDSSQWQVAYCEGGSSTDHCKDTVSGMIPKPLFAGLTNQPITGAPDIKYHQSGQGYMVIFGTGKYIGEPDLSAIYPQALYGIWDWAPDSLDTGYNGVRIDVGASVPKTATLSNWPETDALGNETHTLLRQTVLTEGALDTDGDGVADSSEYYRVISNNLGNWAFDKTNALPATHRFYNKDINEDGSINDEDLIPTANVGWVFDLPGIFDLLGDGVDNDKDGSTDESGERILGERVVNDTLIRDGRSIMVSFGVTGTRCNAGAYSFLNERDANTGGMTAYSIYDLNGDGEIDADDGVELQVNYDVDGDGDVDADDVITAYPSDIAFEGRLFNPAILEKSDDVEEKILGNSQRKMIPLDERKERRGFSYWQQVE